MSKINEARKLLQNIFGENPQVEANTANKPFQKIHATYSGTNYSNAPSLDVSENNVSQELFISPKKHVTQPMKVTFSSQPSERFEESIPQNDFADSNLLFFDKKPEIPCKESTSLEFQGTSVDFMPKKRACSSNESSVTQNLPVPSSQEKVDKLFKKIEKILFDTDFVESEFRDLFEGTIYSRQSLSSLTSSDTYEFKSDCKAMRLGKGVVVQENKNLLTFDDVDKSKVKKELMFGCGQCASRFGSNEDLLEHDMAYH